MGTTPAIQPHRRGLVYSLSLFFMLAVLLSLGALWLMQSDRNQTTLQTPSDAEVLSARLSELKWLSLQALAINVSMTRDTGHRWYNITDAGFPLNFNPLNNQIDLTKFRNIIGDKGNPPVYGNWSNRTNTTITQFSISSVQTDGILLQTQEGMQYIQRLASADLEMDYIRLNRGTANFQQIDVSVYCQTPGGADTVTLVPLNALPNNGPNAMNLTIKTGMSGIAGTQQTSAQFVRWDSPGAAMVMSQGAFARAEIDFKWYGNPGGQTPPYLTITTYPNMTANVHRNDIKCLVNTSMRYADTGGSEDSIWINIPTTIRYGNASYNGPLVLGRE